MSVATGAQILKTGVGWHVVLGGEIREIDPTLFKDAAQSNAASLRIVYTPCFIPWFDFEKRPLIPWILDVAFLAVRS